MPRRIRSLRVATLMALVAAIAVGLGIYRDRTSPRRRWVESLRSADPEFRQMERFMASYGSIPGLSRRDAGRALVDELGDRDPEFLCFALAALRDLDPLPASAVPTLAALTRANDPEIRASAVHALGAAFDPGVREAGPAALLLLRLADPDSRVRVAAVLALDEVIVRSGRFEESAISSLSALLKDPEPQVRLDAALTLTRVGRGLEILPTIDAFVFFHGHGDCRTAFRVLDALAGRSDEALRILVARAYLPGDEPDPEVLRILVRVAAGSEADRRRVIARALDVDPGQGLHRRAGAALVLGAIGAGRLAVPMLIEATRHPEWTVRRSAVRHLAELRPPDPAAVEALRVVAESEKADVIRDLAARALEGPGGRTAPLGTRGANR